MHTHRAGGGRGRRHVTPKGGPRNGDERTTGAERLPEGVVQAGASRELSQVCADALQQEAEQGLAPESRHRDVGGHCPAQEACHPPPRPWLDPLNARNPARKERRRLSAKEESSVFASPHSYRSHWSVQACTAGARKRARAHAHARTCAPAQTHTNAQAHACSQME